MIETNKKSIIINYIQPTVIEEQDRMVEIEDYGKVFIKGRSGFNEVYLAIWEDGGNMQVIKLLPGKAEHSASTYSSRKSEKEIINFCKRYTDIETITRDEYENNLKLYTHINLSTLKETAQ